MPKPEVFLLGAPRCATTSFYDLLSRHPSIYCPAVKEPGYFTRDEVRPEFRRSTPHLRSFEDYLQLFDSRDPAHVVGCDGSTSYLRSRQAMTEIRRTFPDAQAVAVIRDPVDLVAAYFEFLRHECWEDQASVEDAWRIQDQRRQGKRLPAGARLPSSVIYSEVALLGQQVRVARGIFGDALLVFTLDDLTQSPAKVSNEVQRLVGVEPIDLGALPRLNPARTPRFGWLNRKVKTPPKSVARLRDGLKRVMGVPSLGLRRRIEPLNSVQMRYEMHPAFVQELREYFSEDVAILERELGRNLRGEWGWENTPG